MVRALFALITTIIITGVTLAVAADGGKIKRKPTNWQPIIEMKIKGMNAFIDANSITVSETNNSKLSSAEIMISYDSPTPVIVNGKKIVIRSMVKSMIAECKSGLIAPIYDMYFSDPKPTRDSLPLAGTEYPEDVRKTATTITRQSIMYHVMCPEYI